MERRAQHKLKMRLRRAAFDPQTTLETFDFSTCPKVSQKEIADLATCRFVEQHQNVFFVGPSGVGKSHLAQALGHEACRRGYDLAELAPNPRRDASPTVTNAFDFRPLARPSHKLRRKPRNLRGSSSFRTPGPTTRVRKGMSPRAYFRSRKSRVI
ncbi:hypothetical protein AMOR_47240 [Anaeromyxobacter oryzae]|uniref:IstB-like ATP-binding domain-containing protein n=1 Tax=Anaeromyxobacter oryzae TaxID=2918170 RepID=A0ABN6N1K8_9BACT|nr:hypothetical protein AMOR_47240 [Anaeromyxobacter oryzae]